MARAALAVVTLFAAGSCPNPQPEVPVPPPPVPEISVGLASQDISSGDSIDIGTTVIGVPLDVTFWIRNTGSADLVLTGGPPVVITQSGDALSLLQAPASTVAAGQSATFGIRLLSSTTGGRTATVTIANNDSDESDFSFTINGTVTDTVAAPTFDPPGGTYAVPVDVTMSTATPAAEIRYTTDGSAPTSTHGTVYSAPVSISVTTTLKAIACRSGLQGSPVSEAVYTMKVGSPQFTPA